MSQMTVSAYLASISSKKKLLKIVLRTQHKIRTFGALFGSGCFLNAHSSELREFLLTRSWWERRRDRRGDIIVKRKPQTLVLQIKFQTINVNQESGKSSTQYHYQHVNFSTAWLLAWEFQAGREPSYKSSWLFVLNGRIHFPLLSISNQRVSFLVTPIFFTIVFTSYSISRIKCWYLH